MTTAQKFLFDLQGYVVIPNVLDADRVARMVRDMEGQGIREPQNDSTQSRFHGFLSWGEDWRNLVDDAQVVPVLSEIIGPRFRLDHAYGMAMSAAGKGGHETLHHHAGMFHHGCFYATHGTQMHNGLVVVSFALTDIEPGMGGFCCIPGSHKSLFPMPADWNEIENNPLVKQVAQKAGDVLIFTEALTHGTMPWRNKDIERRSALMKFCPHYMQWAKMEIPAHIEGVSDLQRRSYLEPHTIEGMTERQKLILQPPYVWDRETIES